MTTSSSKPAPRPAASGGRKGRTRRSRSSLSQEVIIETAFRVSERAGARARKVDYHTLPESAYPHINAVASAFPSREDPADFETALGLMLDALRSRTRKARAARRRGRASAP